MSRQRTTRMTHACLALRLKLVHRVVSKIYDDALRPWGIRSNQLTMLAFAAEHGALRQAELCTELQIADSTLSRNLERMQAKGWLEQAGGDDQRERPYRLTAEGAALLKRVTPAWQQAQRDAEQLLGADGVAVVRRLAAEQGLTR